jgi:hypothetical protein
MSGAVVLNNSSQMKEVIEVALVRYNRTYFSDGSTFIVYTCLFESWKVFFELYIHSMQQKVATVPF